MSTAPPSQPAQPAASSSSSGSTAAPTHQQSSQTAAQSQSKAQKFAVAEIPPFRANYAQAAGGKSKPTSAANSGTATPAPVMNGSQAASPSASPVPPRNAWGSNGTHARQPSVAAAPAQPASTAAAPAGTFLSGRDKFGFHDADNYASLQHLHRRASPRLSQLLMPHPSLPPARRSSTSTRSSPAQAHRLLPLPLAL